MRFDINGYFALDDGTGQSLYTLPPCRVVDTRNPAGSPPFTGELVVNVTGSGCGVPSGAQSYVLNATVIPSGTFGYLTLWPQGAQQPLVSTLNAVDGSITNNMAVVSANTANGEIAAFASNYAYLLLDVSAYFGPGPSVPLPLSIDGGPGTSQTLATVTVPLAFGISDPTHGANDILWAEFYLADSAGNAHGLGDWGRPNVLDLFDGNAGGATDGFGIVQSDSFCSVSLTSIKNSSDGNSATVVLNLVFNPGFTGTYTVQQLVVYSAEGTGSWESVGSLTIESPPSVSPQPTVTLTDNSQNGGTYMVGDHFTLTVTGPPNQPVGENTNGVAYGTQASTNASGVYSVSGQWMASGSFTELWYVEGVSAAPNSLSFLVAPNFDPPSIPSSYTGVSTAQPCSDLTGNWIIPATPGQPGTGAEWDITQTGTTISGTSYVNGLNACAGSIESTQLSGYVTGTTFTLYDAGSSYCSSPATTSSFSLSGNSCSVGSGTVTLSGYAPVALSFVSKQSQTGNPVATSSPPTPHYLVEYAGYIPVDNVTGPRPCSMFTPFNWLVYKGDAYRGTARVQQAWIVIPGAQHSYNFWANAGPTRNYAPPSPQGPKDVNGNNTLLSALIPGDDPYGENSYSGSDEDMKPDDCFVWNAADHASTATMQQSGSPVFSAPTTTLPFGGTGSNPLEPLSPPSSGA